MTRESNFLEQNMQKVIHKRTVPFGNKAVGQNCTAAGEINRPLRVLSSVAIWLKLTLVRALTSEFCPVDWALPFSRRNPQLVVSVMSCCWPRIVSRTSNLIG